jgi:anti-anti-sigma factor
LTFAAKVKAIAAEVRFSSNVAIRQQGVVIGQRCCFPAIVSLKRANLDTALGRNKITVRVLLLFRPIFSALRARTRSMAGHRRIEVAQMGEVTVVRFVDRKILDEANIQELGSELFKLVEQEKRKNLLLNFSNVEFLSSAALGKLITLDKKVKANAGRLKLSNIRPEIYEVFAITKLNKLFDIKDDEADALAAF